MITHRIRHVCGWRSDVESFAVPAMREVDATCKAIVAVGETGWETTGVAHNIWRAVAIPLCNSLDLWCGSRSAECVVSSKHAEVLRKFLDCLIVLSTVQVVDLVLGPFWNLDEGLVCWVLEIQLRKPVHGLVGFDVDGTAGGLLERLICDGRTESVCANDGVNMATDNTRIHHGI